MSKNSVLTLGQASRIAGCSRDTVRRAAQKNELRAEMGPGKKGPQWWIREADLMDWLQSRGATVAPSPVSPLEIERVKELEDQVTEYARQARQAQQELIRTREQLRQAQQSAADAAQQLRAARSLVKDWSSEGRLTTSVRRLFGY